jgi:plasmid stability protein
MTIELNLPPDVEDRLRKRAATEGRDVSAIVVDLLFNSLADDVEREPKVSVEEFKRRLRTMTSRFPGSGTAVDDGRESIYEGRGE